MFNAFFTPLTELFELDLTLHLLFVFNRVVVDALTGLTF